MDKDVLKRIVRDKHSHWLELNQQYLGLSLEDRKPIKPYLDKLRQDYLVALKRLTEAR